MKICGLFKTLNLNTDKIRIETLNINLPKELENQTLKIGKNNKIEIVFPLFNSNRVNISKIKNSKTYYSIGENGFLLPVSHLVELKIHEDFPLEPLLSPSFYISQVISISTSFYCLPENFNFLTNYIQYKEENIFSLPTTKQIGELLDNSLSFWDTLPSDSKMNIINLLYFYNKSCLTKSSYELYQSLYSVNDLLFKYFFNNEKAVLNLSKKDSLKQYFKIQHDVRMNYLLSALNIYVDSDLLKNIVKLRNTITHELNWNDFILDFISNQKQEENDAYAIFLQEIIGQMLIKTICPQIRTKKKEVTLSRFYSSSLY